MLMRPQLCLGGDHLSESRKEGQKEKTVELTLVLVVQAQKKIIELLQVQRNNQTNTHMQKSQPQPQKVHFLLQSNSIRK